LRVGDQSVTLQALAAPTPWPNANARLLGLGVGLPVQPLQRLAQFSAADFERFTLEWASDYLATNLPGIHEVQQRGGAGDKGRDVVVWFDQPGVSPRRWALYQCKHYATRLGPATAAAEIGKLLFYTLRSDFRPPVEYWFVTHEGVTSTLQDLLDSPEQLRTFVRNGWDKHCADKIVKEPVPMSPEMLAHIEAFDFAIFQAKQPLDLINEHAKTRYHLTVFGAPLIERPLPKTPPSAVKPAETGYVNQLYEVIAQAIGAPVSCFGDFSHLDTHKRLYDRGRVTFYCAEGLKELARDQMADAAFFETLLNEFANGLYHCYSAPAASGLHRLRATVLAAQALQLGGHCLAPHVLANDREGMCHHLANEEMLRWCGD
jgi:hypothetical protein